MTRDEVSIRRMNRDDIGLAVEWAAGEGWNPGLHDADAFSSADPNGFFIAELNSEPVGCISAVAYDDTLMKGKLMIGALTGDIVGSIYEFENIKTTAFPLFQESCCFTDDTVLTVALVLPVVVVTRHHFQVEGLSSRDVEGGIWLPGPDLFGPRRRLSRVCVIY